MYSAILYVDPGLRTGLASWENGKHWAGICDPEDVFDTVERWANEHAGQTALIGCETFTITPQTGKKDQAEMHWPLELIGVCRYLAWRNRITFEVRQSPASAKRFGTDEKLKAVGFYTPGAEDHARDASRHLLKKLVDLRLLRLPAR